MRAPAITAAVTALVLCTACGGGDTAEQSAIKGGYLGYWDSLLQASAVSDPDSAGLAEHAANRQLALVKNNITKARELGLVAKGPVGHRIDSVAVEQGSARIIDCVDLDGWLQYDSHTGALVQNQLTDRPGQLAVYTLALKDGNWVVTDNQVVGSC